MQNLHQRRIIPPGMVWRFCMNRVILPLYWQNSAQKEDAALHKCYALFDFDGTLIRGDSIVSFCRYAHRHGWMSTRALLESAFWSVLYLCRLATAQQSKQAALCFLKGRTEQEVCAFADSFCRDVLLPRLYTDGKKEIETRRSEGCEIWLVSASPSFYLEPLKEPLHLAGVIGTRMHVDEDGLYTGLMVGENCRGIEKPLRLAEMLAARGEMLDYTGSWAYGDTAGDAPMLMQCGHKRAVNARRKLLKALEGQEGVQQVRFR